MTFDNTRISGYWEPLWTPCVCEEWWCRYHGMHVHDCDCPPLDAWIDVGLDPYLDSTPFPE